jgi:hypothetical protein
MELLVRISSAKEGSEKGIPYPLYSLLLQLTSFNVLLIMSMSKEILSLLFPKALMLLSRLFSMQMIPFL